VWQQIWGEVTDLIQSFSAVHLSMLQWKNYWNWSTFVGAIRHNARTPIFWRHSVEKCQSYLHHFWTQQGQCILNKSINTRLKAWFSILNMFVVDEQSDFQKPFAVECKRVCVCVRETSQMALGAVCAAAFVNRKRVSDWKSRLFALIVFWMRLLTLLTTRRSPCCQPMLNALIFNNRLRSRT